MPILKRGRILFKTPACVLSEEEDAVCRNNLLLSCEGDGMTESKLILISKIRQDSRLQPRAKMDTGVIDGYTESMKKGDPFPAVIVFKVNEDLFLVDGYHRFLAAQGAKLDKILAEIHEGTMREAILHSAGVNSTHGLQRTHEDKHRAVLILLRDKEWGQWNDTKIADVCHVSPELVGKIRKSSLPKSVSATSEKSDVRKVERAGKVIKMDVSKIGKTRKDPEERPINGGEKPHTQPAAGTPNHDKFSPQPGGEPAETDLPPQPSLAAQMKEPVITDNTPIISPKSDNPAAVVARPAGMTPDKFNREEVERTAQEFLTALEKVYPKFKIMTDDVLRYHTSWKVKDLLCYGIEAVSTGKVPQSAMMGKGGP